MGLLSYACPCIFLSLTRPSSVAIHRTPQWTSIGEPDPQEIDAYIALDKDDRLEIQVGQRGLDT